MVAGYITQNEKKIDCEKHLVERTCASENRSVHICFSFVFFLYFTLVLGYFNSTFLKY